MSEKGEREKKRRCVLVVSFHREIPFSEDELIVFKQLAEQMGCNAVKAYETDLGSMRIETQAD